MPELKDLEKLVLKAKVRARGGELKSQLENATKQLRTVRGLQSAAAAQKRKLQEERTELVEKKTKLKELSLELAQFREHLAAEEVAQAEELFAENSREIEESETRIERDWAANEEQLAKLEPQLRTVSQQYRELRDQAENLDLDEVGDLREADEIFRCVVQLFPEEAVRALNQEVQAGCRKYGALAREEQYAELKVWIGRYRRLQARGFSREDADLGDTIFRTLRDLSQTYQPGNIEAFRKDFEVDWDQWVEQAEREREAVRDNKRRREVAERERQQREIEDEDKRLQLQQEGFRALDEIRDITEGDEVPADAMEDFHSAIHTAMQGLGAGDETLLELLAPFTEHLEGSEFRAIRRHLERLDKQGSDTTVNLRKEYAQVIDETRGKIGMIIGGDCREDSRKILEDVFEFSRLDWEDYEQTRPAKLKSIKDRVRSGGVDIVLILKAYISHHVPEQLRPLCKQHNIVCLMVEHGYGASQVAQTLKHGLGMG